MLWRMSVDSHPRGSTQMAASRQLVAQTTLHRDKGAVDRHQHGVLSVRQPAPRAALLHGPNRIFRRYGARKFDPPPSAPPGRANKQAAERAETSNPWEQGFFR